MDEDEDCDCDEGWIYLTHAERQVLQKQINEVWRVMLDNAALSTPPKATTTGSEKSA